jgi:hypothetical protein
MYIYNDFLKLKTSELSDYSARGFALCYIETNDHLDIKDEHDDTVAYGMRLFFTEADPWKNIEMMKAKAEELGIDLKEKYDYGKDRQDGRRGDHAAAQDSDEDVRTDGLHTRRGV